MRALAKTRRPLPPTAAMPDPPQSPEPAAGSAVPTQGPVVVLIEDEPEIRRFLRAALLSNGYRLFEATTGREGLQAAETRQPDLIILDLGLPDMDGLEVIRQVRSWTGVPIVVLSAKGQEAVKVAALDAGADDYIAKPFGVGELLARMRVSLRHAERPGQGGQEPTFETGNLQIDFALRRVRVKGADVHLTPIEYRLLTTLAKHAGKVLTRNQLLTQVWGRPYADQAHYLHVHMAQLRRKIEENAARPRYILTEPGVGYRLVSEDT
jgi:two-component system, OmpR family, KDP operon response regulator KdpE